MTQTTNRRAQRDRRRACVATLAAADIPSFRRRILATGGRVLMSAPVAGDRYVIRYVRGGVR